MTADDPNHQPCNRRVCERLTLTRRLMLEIANGDILTGQSVDISPRGVLMESDTPPEMALLGIAGTLLIISEKGHFSIGYPCRVVRLERRSIAWEIEKKAAAAFGNEMAKDLLGYYRRTSLHKKASA